MALQIENYVRKPFAVKAVEVTPQNIYEVAQWCGGEVQKIRKGSAGVQKFIKIDVKRALNERQTEAHYGDWVLLPQNEEPGATFKVYTPKAFVGTFDKQVDEMFEVLGRMDERAKNEERMENEDEGVAPVVNFSNSAS
jgi:hypothetical protein